MKTREFQETKSIFDDEGPSDDLRIGPMWVVQVQDGSRGTVFPPYAFLLTAQAVVYGQNIAVYTQYGDPVIQFSQKEGLTGEAAVLHEVRSWLQVLKSFVEAWTAPATVPSPQEQPRQATNDVQSPTNAQEASEAPSAHPASSERAGGPVYDRRANRRARP